MNNLVNISKETFTTTDNIKIQVDGEDITNYNEAYLKISSRHILKMIRNNEAGWEEFVPEKVAEVIKRKKLFR